MRIVVDPIDPPVPSPQFDFCAYDADTYDGAPDAVPQIMGYGRTREERNGEYKFADYTAMVEYTARSIERLVEHIKHKEAAE